MYLGLLQAIQNAHGGFQHLIHKVTVLRTHSGAINQYPPTRPPSRWVCAPTRCCKEMSRRPATRGRQYRRTPARVLDLRHDIRELTSRALHAPATTAMSHPYTAAHSHGSSRRYLMWSTGLVEICRFASQFLRGQRHRYRGPSVSLSLIHQVPACEHHGGTYCAASRGSA